jgi:putative spermidine/putrescine transport system substrate-binding protein
MAVAALTPAMSMLPNVARAKQIPLPNGPISLNVIDVAGALEYMKEGIDQYAIDRPNQVSKIRYSNAPAPELASKLMAQQKANHVDIDLVLTGTDGLAAGLANGIWEPLFPQFADYFPTLEADYSEPARDFFKGQSNGCGILMSYTPNGPLLEYLPSRVQTPPGSVEELLEWAKQHKGKFMYARPANSGPGRAFLNGLPYILGDKDPTDPVRGWDKTWAYLKELDKYIEYYPSGTGATMKELGEGSRDLIVSTVGWDINPRALGVVPKEAKTSTLKGFHWITDGDFMALPKGLKEDRKAVVLDVMRYMMTPKIQAFNYDTGYMYPGPALRDVPLSLATKHSQDVIVNFGRPEYAGMIAHNPSENPLPPEKLVVGFRLWDEKIGSRSK